MAKLNSTERIVYSAFMTVDVTSLVSCRLSIAMGISEQQAEVTDWNFCISKCRELILAEPQILAYPVLGCRRDIIVIMSQVSFSDQAFQEKLSSMGLEIISYSFADKEALKKAIKFAILTRLAPEWNSVGKFFVAGQNFIQTTTLCSAISLEITIQDNEIQFHLQGGHIELFPIHPSVFGISAPLWEALRQDPCFHIPGSKLKIEFAGPFLLPSLRKGYIQSISGRLPFVCPYKTYPELCRHWEAVYGYVLPQELGKQFFVTVKFAGGTGVAYTYPSLCVHTKPPIVRENVNPVPIIQIFTQALRAKLAFICGNRVEFADFAPFPPAPPLPLKQTTPSKLASTTPTSSVVTPKQKQTKVSQFFAQAKAWGEKWDAEATALPVPPMQKTGAVIPQAHTTPLSDLLQQFRYKKIQQSPLVPQNAISTPVGAQHPNFVFNVPDKFSIPMCSAATPTPAWELNVPKQPAVSCTVTRQASFDSLPASQPPEALDFPEELTQQIICNIQSLCEMYEQEHMVMRETTAEGTNKLSTSASSYGGPVPGTFNAQTPFVMSRDFTPLEISASLPKQGSATNTQKPSTGNHITQLALNTLLFSKLEASKRKEERPLQEANKRPRLE